MPIPYRTRPAVVVRQDVGMKKADPNAVVDAFRSRVNASLADWRAIDAAVTAQASSADRLRLRRRAASDSFLALVIAWESFLSSWVVASVNRAPEAAAQRLTERLTAHATETLNVPEAVLSKSLLATSHLSLDTVRGILDSRGYNTTVNDHAALVKLSGRWLSGPYKVAADGITAYEFSPALIGRLLRNALAHESDAALQEVNRRARGAGVKAPFRVSRARDLDVRSWRAYLFQVPAGETRHRVELFHQEYDDLAASLRT